MDQGYRRGNFRCSFSAFRYAAPPPQRGRSRRNRRHTAELHSHRYANSISTSQESIGRRLEPRGAGGGNIPGNYVWRRRLTVRSIQRAVHRRSEVRAGGRRGTRGCLETVLFPWVFTYLVYRVAASHLRYF